MSKFISCFDYNYLNKIIKSGDAVLIYFYSDWCNPCKLLSSRLEQLSLKYTNIKFIKIDFDKNKMIADDFGINHLPTILGYIDENKLDSIIGFDNMKISSFADKLSGKLIFKLKLKFLKQIFR